MTLADDRSSRHFGPRFNSGQVHRRAYQLSWWRAALRSFGEHSNVFSGGPVLVSTGCCSRLREANRKASTVTAQTTNAKNNVLAMPKRVVPAQMATSDLAYAA